MLSPRATHVPHGKKKKRPFELPIVILSLMSIAAAAVHMIVLNTGPA